LGADLANTVHYRPTKPLEITVRFEGFSQQRYVGKGEVESSILSSSTILQALREMGRYG
jgi:hypothetical protein